MGLWQRKSIGMEISHGGIGGLVVSHNTATPVVHAIVRTPLPAECLRCSLKEPHILQPDLFVAAVRATWDALHAPARSVALSLPDCAGRTTLITLNEPWKNQSEVTAVLRWKLAKRLGLEPDLLHLDFRLLERRQDGSSVFLVALIQRSIIIQYEELFLQAGLQPKQISFHSLNLYQLFSRFLEQNALFVSLYDGTLAVLFQTAGTPCFYRVKPLLDRSFSASQLHRELAASLTAGGKSCGNAFPGSCYVMSSPDETGLHFLLTELGCQPDRQLAADSLLTQQPPTANGLADLQQVTAALGAALGGA